ncbi:MAG: hypothetical protein HRT77_10790 [Halioglobus sp.]|nr:hypothetical protein [Halioglobus sp.]
MLNQLLKFTLVSSLLLWLRPRWKGLLVLCVSVLLVHIMHAEYLGYVELSGDRSFLVWSYVLKWLVLILAVVIYLFFVLSGSRKVEPDKAKWREPLANQGTADDGFDFLRQKDQLKSRADMVINSDSER